jgi:hypothetical protein
MAKNQCSFANLYAAARHIGAAIFVFAMGILAMCGIGVLFNAGIQLWHGQPVYIPDGLARRVLYALALLSLIGAVIASFRKMGVGALVGAVIAALVVGLLAGFEVYRAWVRAVIPACRDNPLEVFSAGGFPLRVRLELVPIQIFVGCSILLSIAMMGIFVCLVVHEMCQFGARMREEEAAERNAAA